MTAFAAWLQSELKTRNWSQSDLARATGLNSGTISNLLNEMRRPGDEICRVIAEALGIEQWVVFMKAGLITKPPREMTARDYRIERLADRLMAIPEEERERLLALAESMADLVERDKEKSKKPDP